MMYKEGTCTGTVLSGIWLIWLEYCWKRSMASHQMNLFIVPHCLISLAYLYWKTDKWYTIIVTTSLVGSIKYCSNIMWRSYSKRVVPLTQLSTCAMKILHIQVRSHNVEYHKWLLFKERLHSPGGGWAGGFWMANFAPILKRTQLMRFTAFYSSIPCICVAFATFWLAGCSIEFLSVLGSFKYHILTNKHTIWLRFQKHKVSFENCVDPDQLASD